MKTKFIKYLKAIRKQKPLTHTYASTHTDTHTYVHTWAYTHIHIHMYIHTYTCHTQNIKQSL